MRRAGLGVVALGLALSVLSGCGGSAVDGYCEALEGHRKAFAEMTATGAPDDALVKQLPMLEQLAGQAPDDLTDEWRTLVEAVKGLDTALDAAGIKAGKYRAGKPPAGLDPAHVEAVTAAAQQLGSAEVSAAASGITQQARDVCKINLGT